MTSTVMLSPLMDPGVAYEPDPGGIDSGGIAALLLLLPKEGPLPSSGPLHPTSLLGGFNGNILTSCATLYQARAGVKCSKIIKALEFEL